MKPFNTLFAKCAIYASLLLFSPSSFASNCESGGSQRELNACASSALDHETKIINRIYGDLRTKLDETQKRQMKDIQLAWIKFRDLECKFTAAGVAGGSVYPMVLDACLAEMTRQRIKELERFLNCKEGDLSCPVAR